MDLASLDYKYFIEPAVITVACIIFWRNHLFAAACYGLVLFLMTQNMTALLFPLSCLPVVVSIGLFLILFYIEVTGKPAQGVKQYRTLTALSVVRFPVNWLYLADFVFRLHHWAPISSESAPPPALSVAVGAIALLPVAVVIVLSVMLIAVYLKKEPPPKVHPGIRF